MRMFRKLFETPQKAARTIVGAAVLAGLLTTGVACTNDFAAKNTAVNPTNNPSVVQGQNQSSEYISVDEAKSIAVEKAGVTVNDVTFQKAKLERDDGLTVYEIEFYKKGIEYDVTIDAVTGDIVEYDVDYND